MMTWESLCADIEKRMSRDQDSGVAESSIEQRRQWLAQFRAAGLPSRQVEDWHYTSLREASRIDWKLAPLSENGMGALIESVPLDFDAIHALFINGELRASPLASGISWSLRDTAEASLAGLPQARLWPGLNEAANRNVNVLDIRHKVERPIVIDFQCVNGDVAQFPRLLIVVHENAKADILLRFLGLSSQMIASGFAPQNRATLTQSFVQVDCRRGSQLTLIKEVADSADSFHFGEDQVTVATNAKVKNLSLRRSGKQVRNQTQIQIVGAGAQVFSGGASLLFSHSGGPGQQGTQQKHFELDNTTTLEHQVGGSETTQLFKCIVNGESKSSFTGTITINQGADLAKSEQLCRHLLLSPNAEANARPILRIYADDVKATHGATVGDLNDEEIFYLQSRGLGKAQAQSLLVVAFLQEVLEQIENNEIRKYLSDGLLAELRSLPEFATEKGDQ